MGYKDLVMYFTTMFAMTNPFGGVGIFLGLVGDQPITTQRQIARKTAFSCFIILLVVTFLGASILNLFGIKIYALQLAGGLIITLMGLHMLQSNQTSMHQVDQDPKQNKTPDIAVVPMMTAILDADEQVVSNDSFGYKNGFETDLARLLPVVEFELVVPAGGRAVIRLTPTR